MVTPWILSVLTFGPNKSCHALSDCGENSPFGFRLLQHAIAMQLEAQVDAKHGLFLLILKVATTATVQHSSSSKVNYQKAVLLYNDLKHPDSLNMNACLDSVIFLVIWKC